MTIARLVCIAAFAATVGGCAFQGVNSLPLPGAVGRGPHANIYHIEIANIGTLESNSPVMMGDVTVGSVGKMRVKGDHADIEVAIKPDVSVPANAVATVGQTSLLGSMHVELNPPLGQRPTGQAGTGDHHCVGSVVVVSLDGADAVGVVGGAEFRWTGPDRRHRAQLQHGVVRPRERRA